MSALLTIENLSLSYQQRGQWREVVHNVSFTLQAGEMVALVGESGSGKTTTAQAIIGLLAENGRRDSGKIVLNGTDIANWSAKRMDGLRGVSISLVPQDPGNSLNPVKTIGDQGGEMLQLHQKISKSERQQRVLELLEKVGLSHPQQRLTQYPHQLSGGMKQRVLIAIALALRPQIIIADEPTSALDVTVQKRILDLLDVLRRESGTCLSRTIWRWRPNALTGFWSFVTERFRNRVQPHRCLTRRNILIHSNCCMMPRLTPRRFLFRLRLNSRPRRSSLLPSTSSSRWVNSSSYRSPNRSA